MRLHFVMLGILLCFLFAGCQQKSNTITITGKLKGVDDNTIITLGIIENHMFNDLAIDTVIDGQFRFVLTDSTGVAKEMSISARGEGFPPTWLNLWAAPGGTITITGNDKLLRSWTVQSNVPQQKELNLYKRRIEKYDRSAQVAMTEAYAQFDSMRMSPARQDVFKARIDSLYAINESLSELMMKAEVDLLGENKTYSEVWMGKLNNYSMHLRFTTMPEAYVDKMKALYEGMPEALKESVLGGSIGLSLFPPKVVGDGDDMADADMWDLDGNLQRLENHAGKYILLDFWSSGCGPCIMSMPELKEVYEANKDMLAIVSISSDTKDVWTKVSNEKDITWTNLNDFKGDDGIKMHYGVTGIPHYVMISPEGKVISSWVGYRKGLIREKVDELVP